MLYILHAVGVQHGEINHAGLEKLRNTFRQHNPRRIEIDGVEVAKFRLA
jgi:hypothetical protein